MTRNIREWMIYRASRVKSVSLYPVPSFCISFSLFLSCTLPLRATNDPQTYPLQKSGFLLSLIPIPIFRFRCSCRRWTRSWISWCTCRPRYPRVVSSKLRDMDFAVHSDVRSANVDQYYQRFLYHNVPKITSHLRD